LDFAPTGTSLRAAVLVSVCFFLSGAAALVLQVLWTRMLGHVFGATALAVSTTLTAFMGGLALGAYLGGKWAPKLRRPLLVFAALEVAVGVYGLFVPTFLEVLVPIQRAMGVGLGTSFLGYSLVRFVIVTLILLLPTTAMGATLPILAEGVVKSGRDVASKVGELYSANTFGAVFGAFFAGFVLIPRLGIQTTVYLAAAIDLGVAGLVVALWRFGQGERYLLAAARLDAPDAAVALFDPVEVVDATPRTARVALVAFALSGAAAMILEVLWTRAVGVIIGASTYAFTLILCTFLVGLSVGAAWMTRRIDRVAEPVRYLARAQVTVGLCAIGGSLFLDKLPLLLQATARSADATIGAVYAVNFGIAALVMLPSALALGTIMPLVVRILAPRGADHAGPIVARAYVLNTLGAIGGSFAGGFVVLPLLGVEHGLELAAGLSLAVGAMLALYTVHVYRPTPTDVEAAVLVGEAPPVETIEPRASRLILAAAAVGVVLLVVKPSWNVPAWTAGLFRYYLVKNAYYHGWDWDGRLLFHKDGIATTVTVEGSKEGVGVSLKVNGKVDASDIGDMPTQVLSGLLPIVAHPGDPKQVLIIGFGSGVTPGAVLQAPVDKVDLVEIEQAVLDAALTHFAHVNHRPDTDPRFTPIVDDGRNFLLTHDRRYDVIISEPSNPWMSGASSLFTQDFWRIAQGRLADDGVFLQWLQLYELSAENVEALFATFRSVFPEVVVFSPSPRSNDTLVLGSRRPISLDRAKLARAFADAKLGAELLRAEVSTPEDFVGLLLQGSRDVADIVKAGRINTDDNALIEFGAPLDLLEYADKEARHKILENIDGRRLEVAPAHFRGFDFDDPRTLTTLGERLVRQGRLTDATHAIDRVSTATRSPGARLAARVARVRAIVERFEEPDSEAVVIDLPETRDDEVYARAVSAMLRGHDRDALSIVESIEGFEKQGPAHRFLHAYLCYRNERTLDAEFLLEAVLADEAFVAANPTVLYYAARIQSDRGRYDRAADGFHRFLDAPRPEEGDDLAAGTSTTATSTAAARPRPSSAPTP
jgi:spermidine synthase